MLPGLSAEEEAARAEARRLAEELLAPGAEAWEERAEFPAPVFKSLCGAGFGAMHLPPSQGGLGLSNRGALAVFEELARGDLALPFALLVQNNCVRSLLHHGTDAQRRRWLGPLTSGEIVGSYAITEPEAGSDAAAMRSAAQPVDRGWVLDGEKCLLTNAPVAGLFVVAAKTDPQQGARGVSTFLVERDAPGLELGPARRTLGARALAVGSLRLRGCRVPAEALLGRPGQGFGVALDAVNFARIVWGGLCVGLARAALQGALDHLGRRVQFGRPLLDFQAIQFQLADRATEVEAARLLACRAAARMDAGEPYVEAAAMAKRFAADMAVRVTSEALELLGGAGYFAPSPLERYLRQARLAQLADGAANIQRLVIARALVKRRALPT